MGSWGTLGCLVYEMATGLPLYYEVRHQTRDRLRTAVSVTDLLRDTAQCYKGIRPVKTERWGAGMVICLDWGADLHTA